MKYTTPDAESQRESAIARLERAAVRIAARGGIQNLRHAARLLDGARYLSTTPARRTT